MPIVEHRGLGFAQSPLPQVDPEAPSWGQIWGSAFHLENDVMAVVDLATRPVFPATVGFDLGGALKAKGLWEDREHFLGTESEDELNYRAQRLSEERQRRDVMERAGWAGVGPAMIAGVLSPTMLLPLTAGGTGLRAVLEGAALAAGAGLAQEVPLQLAQEERTLGESAFGVGTAAVVGGILGGAVSMLGRGELEKIADVLQRDMAGSSNERTIPVSTVGAASAVSPEAGKLKKGVGVNQLAKMFPPTRVLNSDSPNARWLMAQMSDGGLTLEGNIKNIATTPGGTVENRIGTHYSQYYKVAQTIDEQFADLQLGPGTGILRNARANLEGLLVNGKMSKAQFRKEIARAMFNDDQHEIPQVAKAAQAIRRDLIDPIYNLAVESGVFNGNEKVLGDPSYLTRMFNSAVIEARRPEFVGILARHYERKLNDEFTSQRENFLESDKKAQEYIEDVRRPPEEVAKMKEEFQAQLNNLEQSRSETKVEGVPLDEYEDNIRELRRQASQARRNGDNTLRKRLLDDARSMEAAGGATLAGVKSQRAALRRRLKNLTRSEAALSERHAKKLAKIEAVEEANIAALHRVIRAGQKTLRQLDRVSDQRLDDVLSRLKDRFEAEAGRFDKGEERITKLAGDENGDFQRLLAEDARQETRGMKLTEIAEALGQVEEFDRDVARAAIEAALDETLRKVNGINSRRALRAARLEEQAAKIDPATLDEHIARRLQKIKDREDTLNEKFRARGADTVDVRTGDVDFSRYAKEAADEVTENILGTYWRLPTVDIMQTERGAEKARVLDIPTNEVWDFVEQDVEHLMRAYMRTLVPDAELMKKFRQTGATNFDWRNIVRPVVEERNEKLNEIAAKTDKGEEWKQKESQKVVKEYSGHLRDIEATISRLRHTWGIPTDPTAMTTRLGRVVMNLNVLRMMGTVTVSSLPDLGRPVMRYGLLRVFRDAFIPLITNFAAFKLSAREVRLAGGGLDPVTHARAAALLDVLDDTGRGSKFERGVEFATHRMGLIALFDYWTSAMKQLTGVVTNAKLMDDIEVVVTGRGDVAKSTEFLASNGINGEIAHRIWDEVQKGGGNRVNGVWLPNTEDWADKELVTAYRAALLREVNNTIVTPGVERPLFTNATLPGRMLTQFQSFAYSSTTKTLMAGLQQRDAAVVQGVMVSLALGAFSYYIWAMSVGGQAKEEMLKLDPEKWADEAISRSGLTAIFDLGQRVLERIPATAPYATFSGQRNTRRAGEDLIGAIGGPSFDMLEKSSQVLMGIDDPTQSTANATKRLIPYNNVFYIRQGFDQIIKSLGLPESRQ